MLRIALRVRLRSAPLRMTPSVSAAAVEPRSGAKQSAAGSSHAARIRATQKPSPMGEGIIRAEQKAPYPRPPPEGPEGRTQEGLRTAEGKRAKTAKAFLRSE